MIKKKHIAAAYGISRQRVYQFMNDYPGLTVESFADPNLIFNIMLWGSKSKLRTRLSSPAFRQSIKTKLSN